MKPYKVIGRINMTYVENVLSDSLIDGLDEELLDKMLDKFVEYVNNNIGDSSFDSCTGEIIDEIDVHQIEDIDIIVSSAIEYAMKG